MPTSPEISRSRAVPPRPSLSLVLPAYNEAAVIEQALDEADQALSELCDDYEIIVVDDGSRDATAELVSRAIEENPHIQLVRHPQNQGYGAALRNGFAAARMDLVGFTDADCQFDLRELNRLILLAQSYDIACGYRIDRKDNVLRCLYSRVYNWIVRFLLGTNVRDVDCALKLFRRDVVRNLQIRTNGFLVNSELLTQARQHGNSIVEVGVSHRPRAGGESTVSIHHIPRVLASLVRYWWNAVQFPGVEKPHDRFVRQPGSGSIQQEAKALQPSGVWSWGPFVLLLLAAVFLLTNLNYPLIDRDETRYAEIPREMLATGDWVLPQLNFEPYHDKPPLLYWLCAISYSVFGVHEWSARLVPALAGWLTLAATVWFGSRWFGRRVGLWSGVVLSLTAGFLFCSRYLLIDGLFTALVTLSWMTAYEAIRGPRLKHGWWLASALVCGLAFLAKGPLAWVLWMPPVFAFSWLTDHSAKPRLRDIVPWVAITLATAAPWLVVVSMEDPAFLREFIWKHNVTRFAGGFHAKPIWYFLPVILIAGHPWSSLTVPLGRFLLSRKPEHATDRTPALGFLMLWCLWCVAFFTVSKCKLATYVLPIAPAVALIVSVYLQRVLVAPADWGDRLAAVWSPRLATLITCSLAIGFLLFDYATNPESSALAIAWAAAWMIMMALLAVSVRKIKSPGFAWMNSIVAMALFGVMVMHQLVPAYSRSQSLLGDDKNLREQVAAADQVLTFTHEFSEVPFYLNRSNIVHWIEIESGDLKGSLAKHHKTILVVPDRVDLARVHDRLPADATLELIAQRGSGRLVQIQVPSAEAASSIARAGTATR